MPSVGYVIDEDKGEDRLKAHMVEDAIERNKAGLQEIYGRSYRRVFKDLKGLGPDETFTMPDGEVIRGSDILTPARPGRKVVILGDTCDAQEMVPMAQEADVVVHEATNAWIPFLDGDKSPYEVQRETIKHGHSTPQMAGEFAKACKAKKLVLTHFSQRYKDDESKFTANVMSRIGGYASESAGLPSDSVITARDIMTLAVPRPGYEGEE
eukprot:CAMPEP_0184316370 /NCGR_PEP_ID=MMETSP1049-20130417/89619_1 /TAXON_ID=77928 /ORGANISM="Proteomonas sulcata, Strain CCMP704" /LENGTH=209 /DNA_ID=CAMNT_0026635311 /DNA_START=240 /DNA_END=869 /DNA_ORIENTATION=-